MKVDAVRRRHVFFVGGFDPKGAAHYHALYAGQAALQGRVSGASYEVGARRRCADGNAQWTVRHASTAGTVDTTYEFVRWDDIVRAHWPRTAWRVLAGGVATYATALSSGQLGKVWRAAPRTLVPLAYPALFWLSMLLFAVAGAALAYYAAGGGVVVGAIAALAVAAAVLYAAFAWERRLNTAWLLRIYRFAGDWAGGRVPALAGRLDGLAERLRSRLQDPQVDEVLLVGFSVGSMLAVSAAARLVDRPRRELDKLSLLTLGQCIPLLGLMPAAAAFREELQRVGGELTWVDFSSPTDWGSFALVDPVALCVPVARGGPMLASPRFHTLFDVAEYPALRRDKRRMHLQYLMAGALPGEYDYFALTAGPRPLRSRVRAGAAT